MAQRKARQEAEAERLRREEEKRAFKEAQELESLRRTFKRINKKGDGKIAASDLIEELEFLGHSVSEKEAALTIWEVDDDNDGCVDWDEFRTMFYRVRDDASGCEPRKLFNVVDFLMLDKNHSGSVRARPWSYTC
jgi:calmodulin